MALHLDKLDASRLIRIYQTEGGMYAVAHLPETFGIASGAEVTEPFASFTSDGNAASLMRLLGVSNKVGLATTKVFVGPDHPAISVDLKFEAYYDAFAEVIIPVFNLLAMSAATVGNAEDSGIKALAETVGLIKKGAAGAAQVAGAAIGQAQLANQIAESISSFKIQYLKAPSPVHVKFGKVLKIPEAFITSVDPHFSNILDANGYPIEATVSVTFEMIKPPTRADFYDMVFNASSD